MITIPYEVDSRTRTEQYWQGFNQFCTDDSTGDYLSAGELTALTPEEMQGYVAAQKAAADCETDSYLSRTERW